MSDHTPYMPLRRGTMTGAAARGAGLGGKGCDDQTADRPWVSYAQKRGHDPGARNLEPEVRISSRPGWQDQPLIRGRIHLRKPPQAKQSGNRRAMSVWLIRWARRRAFGGYYAAAGPAVHNHDLPS